MAEDDKDHFAEGSRRYLAFVVRLEDRLFAKRSDFLKDGNE